MGQYRERIVDLNLADGAEIRIADAPISETIENLVVTLAPWQMGSDMPAGGGNLVWTIYYGGGFDKPEQVYAAGTLQTGVSKATGNIAGAAADAFPVKLYTDASTLPSNRYRDGMEVREVYGNAYALHLYNNTGGGNAVNVRVIISSETVTDKV